jgi:uncharacterized protein YcbK (DUF882 family)
VRAAVRALLLLLSLGLVLAGCAAVPPPPAPVLGPGRSIVLVHSESREKVAVTYWRHGVYDPQAMGEIAFLFRDRRTGEVRPVAPGLIDFIVDVRERMGVPDNAVIQLLSGYRSPQSNAELAKVNGAVAENSYHIQAMAADIRITGIPGRMVSERAKAMRRGGVAHYPRTDHVHLDVGPVRTWWAK